MDEPRMEIFPVVRLNRLVPVPCGHFSPFKQFHGLSDTLEIKPRTRLVVSESFPPSSLGDGS